MDIEKKCAYCQHVGDCLFVSVSIVILLTGWLVLYEICSLMLLHFEGIVFHLPHISQYPALPYQIEDPGAGEWQKYWQCVLKKYSQYFFQ